MTEIMSLETNITKMDNYWNMLKGIISHQQVKYMMLENGFFFLKDTIL